jgi:hypothetical protein
MPIEDIESLRRHLQWALQIEQRERRSASDERCEHAEGALMEYASLGPMGSGQSPSAEQRLDRPLPVPRTNPTSSTEEEEAT